MAITLDDNVVWGTVFAMALFFTYEGSRFPLRVVNGPRVAAGTIWGHIKAMVYPFLAAACWWVMSAFAVADSGAFAPGIYVLFYGLFWMFVVIGFAMTIYLALRPIQEVLEGKERLED